MKKPIDDIKWAHICLCILLGIVVCVFVWLAFSYVHLLVTERDGWLKFRNDNQFYNDTVYGDRGNIYDCQGRLVQASFPYYKVEMDLRVPFLKNKYKPPKNSRGANTDSISNYEAYADSVCVAVSDYFKQCTHAELRKKMDEAFRKGNGNFKIVEGRINFKQLNALKEMPLFNQGKLHSGLLVETYENRENLYGQLAYRVVGAVFGDKTNKKHGRFGIEQSFDEELAGTPGIFLRRAGAYPRPIQRPVDGLDVVMTLDMDIQDKCETLLKKSFSGTHGKKTCMIVMETATGEIKAMVNLRKDSVGGIISQGENYCISEWAEPGSTIKPIAMLAMLEDGKCDIDKNYRINYGYLPIGKDTIEDTHHDSLYLKPKGIMAYSSNCGMSLIAIEGYGNNRKGWKKFYNAMQDMRFTHKIGLQLGKSDKELLPQMYDPETYTAWSLTTMPSMAYGYEIMMTPLYTLNFFNAVANGGYYVKPHVIRELRKGGEVVHDFSVSPESSRIASKKNIALLNDYLLEVVERPHATGYYGVRNDQVKIAGKTGTAQLRGQFFRGRQLYQVTFVGYFPVDKPQYTAIVVMVGNLYEESAARYCGSVVRDVAKYLMVNY